MSLFNSSYQNISFRQQIISANQNYPCPRCSSGMLETFGLTETYKCTSCERNFVALRGGRYLYPANNLGVKIAPTFWWDGLRWHWAGTTASTRQLVAILVMFSLPLILVNLGFTYNSFKGAPEWLSMPLALAAVSLVTIQAIYFLCWDFDFVTKKRNPKPESQVSEPPPPLCES